MKLMEEEIFGPVLTVFVYEDKDLMLHWSCVIPHRPTD